MKLTDRFYSLYVGTDCQLTSGAAHSTNILALKTDVKFEGPVKTYESAAASGNIITRSFCSICLSPSSPPSLPSSIDVERHV